jgi:hypothetical protein
MTNSQASLITALEIKPSSQKRSGVFVSGSKLKPASHTSQAACGGMCSTGACSHGLLK